MVKRIEGSCRLVPVLLDISHTEVPQTLRGILWVRLEPYDEGLRKLVENGWNTAADARTLAVAAVSSGQDVIYLSEADHKLRWGPRRINPAADDLVAYGHAQVHRGLGADPYAF
jgi:hypothetical protein